jgi:hypothetical protein
MEDEEALKTSALVSQFSDAVQNQVHNFFANCVMAPGIVVCSIFLSSYQLLRMEQLSVRASADLICRHTSIYSNLNTCKQPYRTLLLQKC